ncbi:uncharacterized protein BKCO1_7600024 [Diplodia corticola]|uniref:Uncharacterized protein n=1 Tax=Diplodia corticola TaxID=236234 RepID=A0A1J9QL79_9PEZI|nr:uncharacterized protein BKCO1_7600024 [Diplodia corticola]OJD29646.1 hypothetical protein BKCO1_7600024 [Diplodia corticola]
MTSTTDSVSSTSKRRGAGPLTTVFTTPEFCASSAWNHYDTPALSSSICMPSGFTTYWNYKYGFYSPAICPESYTQGCTFPATAATLSNGTPFLGGPLEDGESAIICCPAGYTCMGSPSTDVYAWSKCIATTASTYTMAYPTVSAYTTTPLVFAIQVRWKEADLNALETNPTKSGETITPTATSTSATAGATAGATSSLPTGTASATSGAGASSPDDGDGLSTGAKIGLGVGIGVAAVVLGILAYLVWRRRRADGRQLVSTSPEGGSGGMGGTKGGFSELQDTQIGERGSTSGGREEATELESPEGTTWNSSTWGGSTMISPLTPRPETGTTATGAAGEATEMEVPETRHEMAGHVTDFAEMPASNQFVAELPGDTPVQHREKWS